MNRGGIALLALAAQAPGVVNSNGQINVDCIGLIIYTNITANPGGTAALTVKVQAKDQVSGNWIDIPGMVSASLSTVAQQAMLYMLPGTVETANARVSFSLPAQWRVVATVGGSGSITGTISGETLSEGPAN